MNGPGRIYYVTRSKGNAGRVYNILGPDETTQLYTIGTSEEKPNMTAWRHHQPHPVQQYPAYQSSNSPHIYGSTHSPPSQRYNVGTVNFHSLSSKIEVSLNTGPYGSQPTAITMKRADLFSSGREFPSAMGTLQWKEDSGIFGSNLKLVDKYKRVIARYEKRQKGTSMFSRGKQRFILLGQGPAVDMNVDMIILTGVATIEYDKQADDDWGEVLENII